MNTELASAPASQTTAASSPSRPAGTRSRWRNSLQQLLAVASLVIIVIVFAIINPDSFLTLTNLSTILTTVTTVGLLALGVTFIIITGGIDLSVGTGMILCGVMAGVFITNMGLPLPVGIALTIGFGGLIGLINGFNVAVLGLPSFIATLGMMMVTQGLSLVISGTKPIYFTDEPGFGAIMNASLVPGMRLPLGTVLFLVLIVVSVIILQRPLIGRTALALGSNARAPRRRRHRAAGDRCGDHRRHLARRRPGVDDRHGHRRAHHGRPRQRPADGRGRPGMAAGRHRRRRPPRRLPRHRPEEELGERVLDLGRPTVPSRSTTAPTHRLIIRRRTP